MKAKPTVLEVMYRKYTNKIGEVLALFPYMPHDSSGSLVACYAHLGQHGCAEVAHVMASTRPARPDEYADLHRELTQIYELTRFPRDPLFKLRIIKRRSTKRLKSFPKANS